MSLKLSLYNREVRRYDRDLFCERSANGKVGVFRKTKRFIPIVEEDGFRFLNLIEAKEFVFAITDTWGMTGNPRDWGVDFVLNRLREIDTQANERLFEQLEAEEEKVEKSKARHLRNEAEAFWSDNRRAFVKATDDILIHSLSKDEPNKRIREKRVKNGNY